VQTRLIVGGHEPAAHIDIGPQPRIAAVQRRQLFSARSQHGALRELETIRRRTRRGGTHGRNCNPDYAPTR